MPTARFLVYAFLFMEIGIFAQTGRITGKVIDQKSGETLPGAIILIQGTTQGSATDLDGNYIINNVKPGTYTIVCRFISYDDKAIGPVTVKEGEATYVNFSLAEAGGDTLNVVTVTATLEKENTSTLFIMQKNNVSVSDGVSAEAIRKTPDRSTSDVLKRVSGASIQDNRFAIIRGLSDRYNAAFINGAPLPSSESDRKAFAFDIFPASILDNLIIIKTATPDIPGDFAGGVIQINTKSIPVENIQTLSIAGAWNGLTTNKDFYYNTPTSTSWLGLDDGTRAVPEGIPSTAQMKATTNNDLKAEYAKKMLFDWSHNHKKAGPAGSIQYSVARNEKLFKRDFGLLFAVNYLNNPQTNFQDRYEWDDYDTGSVKTMSFKDEIYSQNVLSSALLNLSYRISDNHRISSKNLASTNSANQITRRDGSRNTNDPEPNYERSSVQQYTSNVFKTTQLAGDHFFPRAKVKAKWTGGYSKVNRNVPAMLQSVYTYDYNTDQYVAAISDLENPIESGNMFWSYTNESIKSVRYDISRNFNFTDKLSTEIKVGGYHQKRDRNFDVRSFKFGKYKRGSSIRFDNELLLLPHDEIFTAPYMGSLSDSTAPYTGGFKLNEITKVSDSYDAFATLHAAYVMFDTRVFEKHRIIWGARMESYRQQFGYIESGSNIEKFEDTTVVDILPSVNYIFSLTQKINIRAAYYRTVSRPEFRELAPFSFYNFVQSNIWSGNPQLKRALVNNYDLRFEWYPGAAQILSVTGFYKTFANPIESVLRTGISGDPELYYANASKVTNLGAELEYRVNLGFISHDTDLVFDNLTLFSNLAIVKSTVDTAGIIGAQIRPLQGQSPYIVNAGLNYQLPKYKVSFAASYNVVGPRIFVVGNVQEPHVWEKERHVLDLQLAKSFLKNNNLEIKFNVRDVFANNQVFYQDINENNKFDKGDDSVDNIVRSVYFGPSYTLTAGFRF